MERYDYFSAVKEDVKIVVMNEYNYSEELEEELSEDEDE